MKINNTIKAAEKALEDEDDDIDSENKAEISMAVADQKAKEAQEAADKAKKEKAKANPPKPTPKGQYETMPDFEVEIKSEVNRKDFAGKYKRAKATADN